MDNITNEHGAIEFQPSPYLLPDGTLDMQRFLAERAVQQEIEECEQKLLDEQKSPFYNEAYCGYMHKKLVKAQQRLAELRKVEIK